MPVQPIILRKFVMNFLSGINESHGQIHVNFKNDHYEIDINDCDIRNSDIKELEYTIKIEFEIDAIVTCTATDE